MRSLLTCLLVGLMLLSAAVSPVLGCINDREAPGAEREFKSSYPDQPGAEPPAPASESPSTDFWVKTTLASGIGAALLAGAVVLGVSRGRRT
jgi:hypothetical protein